jgi:hypothetical protein
MTEATSAEASGDGMYGSQANTGNKLQAKSVLTKIAAFVADRNIPFLVCSIGMIVMLLWAGKFKMTAPGAEGIIPLVTNSRLSMSRSLVSIFIFVFPSGDSCFAVVSGCAACCSPPSFYSHSG